MLRPRAIPTRDGPFFMGGRSMKGYKYSALFLLFIAMFALGIVFAPIKAVSADPPPKK
jgi:hypothetical protein